MPRVESKTLRGSAFGGRVGLSLRPPQPWDSVMDLAPMSQWAGNPSRGEAVGPNHCLGPEGAPGPGHPSWAEEELWTKWLICNTNPALERECYWNLNSWPQNQEWKVKSLPDRSSLSGRPVAKAPPLGLLPGSLRWLCHNSSWWV